MKKKRGPLATFLHTAPSAYPDALRSAILRFVEPEVIRRLGGMRVIERVTKAYSEVSESESGRAMISDLGIMERAQALSGLYEVHNWIHICTAKIATALPQAKLKVYRKKRNESGEEELEHLPDHPLQTTLDWISEVQSPFSFWEHVSSHLLLTGRSHVALTQPAKTAPDGTLWDLIPMMPHGVDVIAGPNGIAGYTYSVGGKPQPFAPWEVLSTFTYSPFERFRGQGVPTSSYNQAASDLKARKFNLDALTQGIYLDGILSTENTEWDADDAEAARKVFESKYAGADPSSTKSKARVAVLYGGLKFDPTRMKHADIQWLESLKLSREEIAMAYNIPLEVLGLLAANYATLKLKERMFWTHCVCMLASRIASDWNSNLVTRADIPDRKDIVLAWDYTGVEAMQRDAREAAQAGQVAISSGQMTPNEARRRLHDMEPYPSPAADVLYIGTMPMEMAAEVASRPKPEFPGSGNDDDSGDGEREESRSAERMLLPRGPLKLALASRPAVVTLEAEEWRAWWRRTQAAAENAFMAAEVGVLNDLRQAIIDLVPSTSTLEYRTLADIERLFAVDGAKEVAKVGRAALHRHAERAGAHVWRQSGMSTAFDLRPTRALARLAKQEQRIRNMMGRRWVGTEKRPGLRRVLMQSMELGEPQKLVERRVRDFFSGMKDNFVIVARTEVCPALNGAGLDTMRIAAQAGVKVRAKWRTFGDAKVRGLDPKDEFDHAAMEGKSIDPRTELFNVSGEKMEYPGDWENGASEGNTIGCRCTLEPHVTGVSVPTS